MSPQILVRSIIFTIPPPNLIVILKDKFVKENLATSDDEELTDSEETKDSLSELVEDRRREERAILQTHLNRSTKFSAELQFTHSVPTQA